MEKQDIWSMIIGIFIIVILILVLGSASGDLPHIFTYKIIKDKPHVYTYRIDNTSNEWQDWQINNIKQAMYLIEKKTNYSIIFQEDENKPIITFSKAKITSNNLLTDYKNDYLDTIAITDLRYYKEENSIVSCDITFNPKQYNDLKKTGEWKYPVTETHELLHCFRIDHSENKADVMYPEINAKNGFKAPDLTNYLNYNS